MKKYLSENTVNVPTFFTRGMSVQDQESFEETYKAVAWMLRIMRKRLEDTKEELTKQSEDLVDHHEMLKNAALRKAYSTLINYLPENLNAEQ